MNRREITQAVPTERGTAVQHLLGCVGRRIFRHGSPRRSLRVSPRFHLFSCGLIALSCSMTACIDDTVGGQTSTTTDGRAPKGGLLVVATDYESTSLSWLDPAALKVTSARFLHSGSAVSSSGSTLSGDVVPGSDPLADGRFPVVDRGHSTITWVGGDKIVQWPVTDGFQANPQDVWRYEDEVFVVRAQPDPTPTSAPLSGGDDVLILSTTGAPVGRIPLAAEATLPGAMAFAGRGVRFGERLWLPLASFAADFTAQGHGRVVEIDLKNRKVTRRVDVKELRNCTTLQKAGVNIVGTCSGFFQDTLADQVAQSGVFRLDPSAGTTVVVLKAADIGGPIGFPITQGGGKWGWITRLGQLSAPARADEVWRYDPMGVAPPAHAWTGSKGFAIGGLWYEASKQRLWLSDAANSAGDLVVLNVAPNTRSPDGKPQVVATIRTQTGGLPAVHLAPASGDQ